MRLRNSSRRQQKKTENQWGCSGNALAALPAILAIRVRVLHGATFENEPKRTSHHHTTLTPKFNAVKDFFEAFGLL